jgi:hypothetical protein
MFTYTTLLRYLTVSRPVVLYVNNVVNEKL